MALSSPFAAVTQASAINPASPNLPQNQGKNQQSKQAGPSNTTAAGPITYNSSLNAIAGLPSAKATSAQPQGGTYFGSTFIPIGQTVAQATGFGNVVGGGVSNPSNNTQNNQQAGSTTVISSPIVSNPTPFAATKVSTPASNIVGAPTISPEAFYSQFNQLNQQLGGTEIGAGSRSLGNYVNQLQQQNGPSQSFGGESAQGQSGGIQRTTVTLVPGGVRYTPSGGEYVPPVTAQVNVIYNSQGQPLSFYDGTSPIQQFSISQTVQGTDGNKYSIYIGDIPTNPNSFVQNLYAQAQNAGGPEILVTKPINTSLSQTQGTQAANTAAQIAQALYTYSNGTATPIQYAILQKAGYNLTPQTYSVAQQAAQDAAALSAYTAFQQSQQQSNRSSTPQTGPRFPQVQNLSLDQLPIKAVEQATTNGLPLIFASPSLSDYNNLLSNIKSYLSSLNSPDYQLEQQLFQNLAQSEQNNIPIGQTGYNINVNPYSYSPAAIATGLSTPGYLQNVGADFNQFLGKIYSYLTGNPATQYIPFNPTGNYLTQNIEASSGFLPALIQSLPVDNGIQAIGKPALQFLGGVPVSAIGKAAAGIANPNTPALEYALDLGTLGTSFAAPGTATKFGLGAEGVGNILDYVLGYPSNPQTAAANYQFGAGTAPIFEGIGAANKVLGLEGLQAKALQGFGTAGANLGITNLASYAQQGTPAPITSDVLAAGLPLAFELNPFSLGIRTVFTPSSEEITNELSENAEGGKTTSGKTITLSQATQEAALGNSDLFPRGKGISLIVGEQEVPIISYVKGGFPIQIGSIAFDNPEAIAVSQALERVNNASPLSEGTMTLVKSYLKNLALATGTDSWQTQIAKLGVSLAGTFRDAVLPASGSGIELEGLSSEQNAVLNEALSNPQAVLGQDVSGRIYGTGSVQFQLGSDFRAPHDIDFKITTDTPELADTFAERLAAALNGVDGNDRFVAKDNTVLDYGDLDEKGSPNKVIEVKTNVPRPEDVEGALQPIEGKKLGYGATRDTLTTPQGAQIAPIGETILGKLSSALGIRWTQDPDTGEPQITLNSATKRGDAAGSKDYADAIAIMQRYLESSQELSTPSILNPQNLIQKLEQFKQLAIDNGLVSQEKIDESLNEIDKNGIPSSYTPKTNVEAPAESSLGYTPIAGPSSSSISVLNPTESSNGVNASSLFESPSPTEKISSGYAYSSPANSNIPTSSFQSASPSSSQVYTSTNNSPTIPSPSTYSSTVASPSPSIPTSIKSPSTSPSTSISPSPSPYTSPYQSPYASPYASPPYNSPPYKRPLLNGNPFFAKQVSEYLKTLAPDQRIYTASLLTRLFPKLEQYAEQNYSPLLQASTIRPQFAPRNAAPLILSNGASNIPELAKQLNEQRVLTADQLQFGNIPISLLPENVRQQLNRRAVLV